VEEGGGARTQVGRVLAGEVQREIVLVFSLLWHFDLFVNCKNILNFFIFIVSFCIND
jgi:hypothetical protein